MPHPRKTSGSGPDLHPGPHMRLGLHFELYLNCDGKFSNNTLSRFHDSSNIGYFDPFQLYASREFIFTPALEHVPPARENSCVSSFAKNVYL